MAELEDFKQQNDHADLMQDLDKKQEDDMLEQGREFDAEIREERNRECQMGIFECWFADNKRQLLEDFAEENEQMFRDFCREEFKYDREMR
jgi:hypothetical protein